MKHRARWLRLVGPICVGSVFGTLIVAACSVPDFEFRSRPLGFAGDGTVIIDHCVNGLLDTDLGESDFDCGGGCPPCELGSLCADTPDCAEGLCHEGTCIPEGCTNDAQDGPETDVDCGGESCRPCGAGQGCTVTTDCESGVCRDNECAAPACDDQVENGKETGLDCGGDCRGCLADDPCLVAGDCVSGECNDGICGSECNDGFANCDKKNDNACEVSTRTDAENCGFCGNSCDLPHAVAECRAGQCRIAPDGCEPGYRDCDSLPEDGCEVDLKTNKLNCGSCNKMCADINGDPSCQAGVCKITCSEGFDDCDGNLENGCEVNLNTNARHCGECAKVCPVSPGYGAFCKVGVCGQTQCPAGKGDCNGNPADGCETTVTDDIMHCGSCSIECAAPNANVACVAGKCQIASCKGAFADCANGQVDGCETGTDVSTSHCGGCGKPCETLHATGSTCMAGTCNPTCQPGWANCTTPEKGCVTPLGTTSNCTQCGQVCSGATPFCDPTGCIGFRDIVVVNSSTTGVGAWGGNVAALAELKLNHALVSAKGNHRMVLVGVTAMDNFTNPPTAKVEYAAVPMHRAFQQTDVGEHSYAGIFYLLDSELPNGAGTNEVIVSLGGNFPWGHAGAQVVELKNTMQVAPFASGGGSGDASCTTGGSRSGTVTFSQAGSLVYGLLGARAADAATLTGTPTVVQLWNQVVTNPAKLLSASAYVFDNDNRTMTWNITNCENSAIALVAVKRLSAN